MHYVLYALMLFVYGALADWAWAKWSASVTAKRPIVAANFSILILASGGWSFVTILSTSLWLFIPYWAGAWVGTYLTVKRS